MTVKDSEQMDKMPTNIYISDIDGSKCRCWGMEVHGDDGSISKEYTLVHNNPEYHVIKKSDVQALKCHPDERVSVPHLEWEALKNALIAQSDMVTIPRDVLEGMKTDATICCDGINKVINDVLNYKKAGE